MLGIVVHRPCTQTAHGYGTNTVQFGEFKSDDSGHAEAPPSHTDASSGSTAATAWVQEPKLPHPWSALTQAEDALAG